MARTALTAVYFVLTFLAGAAVGSWCLWIYLVGGPSGETPTETTPVPLSASPALPETDPTDPTPPTVDPGEAPGLDPATPSTPTSKGHWDTVDIPGRSHEECLALTRQLDDAYKDCRFGIQKRVWIEEP